jgi:DNA-binding FrmR family transcriptional regulator
MAVLQSDSARNDLLNRLKRAEGQLRGIQRMISEGDECLAIAQQLSAVRKALDSTYLRMTLCFVEQQLQSRLPHEGPEGEAAEEDLSAMLEQMEALFSKIR